MTAEEWSKQHSRYEKYAKPIFNRALKDSFANVKTMIPLINYENYQQLIVASFNFAPMQQAYLKVYTRVGLVQGNRIGRELNSLRPALIPPSCKALWNGCIQT